jgi:hypothetical protein
MYTKAVSLLALAGAAQAHMSLWYPGPLGGAKEANKASTEVDAELNFPLGCCDGEGAPSAPSPGVCRGHLDLFDTEAPQVTWQAGGDAYFQLSDHTYTPGAAGSTHYGGSCQVGFSTDRGETWKVAASYNGNCPLRGDDGSPDVQTFDFKVPTGMPEGKALFAWIWLNREHESFMNCAAVQIGQGSGNSTTPTNPPKPSGSATQPTQPDDKPSYGSPPKPSGSATQPTQPDDKPSNGSPSKPTPSSGPPSSAPGKPSYGVPPSQDEAPSNEDEKPSNDEESSNEDEESSNEDEGNSSDDEGNSSDEEGNSSEDEGSSSENEESSNEDEGSWSDSEDEGVWSEDGEKPSEEETGSWDGDYTEAVESKKPYSLRRDIRSRTYMIDGFKCACTSAEPRRCPCSGGNSIAQRGIAERKALRKHRREAIRKRASACDWNSAPSMIVSYYTSDAACAPNAKINTPESDTFEIGWEEPCGVVEGDGEYPIKPLDCNMFS